MIQVFSFSILPIFAFPRSSSTFGKNKLALFNKVTYIYLT